MTKRHIEIVLAPEKKKVNLDARRDGENTPSQNRDSDTEQLQGSHLSEGTCGCGNCS